MCQVCLVVSVLLSLCGGILLSNKLRSRLLLINCSLISIYILAINSSISAGLASGSAKGALAQSTSRREQEMQQSPSGHSTACHHQPRALLPKTSATSFSLSFALGSSMVLPFPHPHPARLTYAP